MTRSAFPFNQDHSIKTRPYVRNPGTTPAAIDEFFSVDPVGTKQRRDYLQKRVTTVIYALDNTFTKTIQAGEGSVIWVSSSDQTAFVRIEFSDDQQSAGASPSTLGFVARNGFRIAGRVFNQLLITNPTAQAGLTVEVSTTRDFPDDRVDVQL